MKYLRIRLCIFITFMLIMICIVSTSMYAYATNDESLMYKNSD